MRAVFAYLGPAILVLLGVFYLIWGYGAYALLGLGSVLVVLGAISALAVRLAHWSRVRYGGVRARFACPPWLVLAVIGALFVLTGFPSSPCAQVNSGPPFAPGLPCVSPEPGLGFFLIGIGLLGAFFAFVFTWNPKPRNPAPRPS